MWAEFQLISIFNSEGFSLGTPVFLPHYPANIPSGCGAVLRGHALVMFMQGPST